jgi:hypothetical protein
MATMAARVIASRRTGTGNHVTRRPLCTERHIAGTGYEGSRPVGGSVANSNSRDFCAIHC